MRSKSLMVRLLAQASVFLLWPLAHAAQAAIILVDDDGVECVGAAFSTIQAAVDAAPSGSRIRVCPGTYPEQVVVSRPVRIVGDSGAIVKPAAVVANTTSLFDGSPIAALILAMDTVNVTLEGLTVDGADNGLPDCSTDLVGIFFRNASGVARKTAVRNVRMGAGLEGCQVGFGIFAQSGGGGTSRVLVDRASVHDFQKNGILGNELGTNLRIFRSVVMGLGPTTGAAQTGVQFGFGAIGFLSTSVIANHVWSPCVSTIDCAAVGIDVLAFDPGLVRISNNTLGKSQAAVFVMGANARVLGNTILDTDVLDAIALMGDGNRALNNTLTRSGEAAVFVDGNLNRVIGNFVNDAPIGVWTFGGLNNVVARNEFVNTDVPLLEGAAPLTAAVAAGREQPVRDALRP